MNANTWGNLLLTQRLLIACLSGIFVFVALVALVVIIIAIKEKMDEKARIKKRRIIISVITDIIKRRKKRQKEIEKGENQTMNKMNKKKIILGGLAAILGVATLGVAAFLLVYIASNFTMKDATIMAASAGAMAYIALLWILAKKNPKFAGEIILIGGGVALTTGVLFAPLTAKLFVVILALPLLLLVFAATLLGIRFKDKIKGEGDKDGKRGIIYQVPSNHRLVLRNTIRSNPTTLEGYIAQRQGYNWRIPVLYKDEGLVSLVPVQEDPQAFTTNCRDGNPVEVDARVTFYVRDEEINNKHASLYYVINIKNEEDAHKLVHQRVKVALNRAMNVESDKAISWTKKKKEKFGRDATVIINDLLRNDKPEVEEGETETKGKDYGLAAIVNVQNIRPTGTVQAAKEMKKAAEINLKAAEPKAEAMKTMIGETGANATAVMVAQLLADTFMPIIEKTAHKKKEKNNEK